MKIVIDARESGTSTGRYIDKLVEYMHKLQPNHEIVILCKKHRVAHFNHTTSRFAVDCACIRQVCRYIDQLLVPDSRASITIFILFS